MKILFLLPLFFLKAYALEIKAFKNGLPTDQKTKVNVGEVITVSAESDHWVKIEVNAGMDGNTGWTRSKASISRAVTADHLQQGYISFTVMAKDDDAVGSYAGSADDETHNFSFHTVVQLFKADPDPAKILSFSLKRNGQTIQPKSQVNLGDVIELSAESDQWVRISANAGLLGETDWLRSRAVLSQKIGKEHTESGSLMFTIDARDDDKIGTKPGLNVDATQDLFVYTTKTFIPDSTPASIRNIRVDIGPANSAVTAEENSEEAHIHDSARSSDAAWYKPWTWFDTGSERR